MDDPSEIILSSIVSSRIRLKFVNVSSVANSITMLSSGVRDLNKETVPVSCNIPPPIIATSPVAGLDLTSRALEVNVTISPTEYPVPTLSIITASSIFPRVTSSTTTSAKLLPRTSKSIISSLL